MAETIYSEESKDVRGFLARVADAPRIDERTVAERAGEVLDAFAERLKATDVPGSTVLPARYAMAVVIDHAVRALPSVKASSWLAAAHVHVFDRREMTVDQLRHFATTAADQGAEYEEFSTFLNDVIDEIDGRRRTRTGLSSTPTRTFWLAFGVYLLCLTAYTGYLDYRYHADLTAAFEERFASLTEDRSPDRLAAVGALHRDVIRASDAAPLSKLVTLPFWTSGPKADAAYRAEASATLPDALREAIGEALATEGENIELYDSLRAWAILTGRSEWAPEYLAGWIEARAQPLGLIGLADHVPFLDGPEPRLAVPDEALMEQARELGLGATEAERAYLELVRSAGMRALGLWLPTDHVAEIEDIFVFRSGRPLNRGVHRTFTPEGWDFAMDGALDDAIRTARIEAAKLFPEPAATSFDTRTEVADRLQDETLAVWTDWLEDLRVRPFIDGQSAKSVSGALSRGNSPLQQVVEQVWQAAGGEDPARPVAARARVEKTFGAAVDYVRAPEFGALSDLFASLNVALVTIERDESRGIDALLGLQERAQAGAVLRTSPPLVAQIAEDVLAQTSATHAQVLSNPLTREWQARVYPVCQRAIDGRYPFHRGSDADLAGFDDFFGARGALIRFYRQYAERNLDTSGEVWRWSTDARLNGLTPESAAFLQRAVTISRVFYQDDAVFGTEMEIALLAERGEARIALGGTSAVMQSTGYRLFWPGNAPEAGMEVTFVQDGSVAQIEEPGVWGLLRLMDQTSIRNRDEGRRQLVDLRVYGGRLFFELTFPTTLNPIAARDLLKGLACPAVL